ncbi:MAG: tRNA guanosine(34) transglycosylase Tgt, partial [Gammaproteobacteria bacterium]
RLMTLHNLRFYQQLMQGLRDAIGDGSLETYVAAFLEGLRRGPS